jgi:hypothetical protein
VLPLVLALALAGPPQATLSTGSGSVRLAISSWCWGARCGAPIAAAARTAVVPRGRVVTVELAFVPKSVRLAVAGAPVTVLTHGREVSWSARRGGGLTLRVTGGRGWVSYVGRIRLR